MPDSGGWSGPRRADDWKRDLAVVGGCGRVGLPLGLAFAGCGAEVTLFDVNPAAVDRVKAGKMPFAEDGAQPLLDEGLASGRLMATTDPASLADVEHVVVVIGTPVSEYLTPDPSAIPVALEALSEHLRPGQLLILRSTVFPGVTALVERLIDRLGLDLDVAFCPERIAEGKAMVELVELPQIIAARTPRARERAAALFGRMGVTTIDLEPEEAELAKLFTNVWRYVKFATANQLYMLANDHGLDFERIRQAMITDYPRAADLPGAGFAAGPCLFKDTMQLASFDNQHFALGHASMQINEGLPLYLIDRLDRRFDLPKMTVGILGMAFKAGSDDRRASLSYKLAHLMRAKALEVITTDPYVTDDPELLPLDEVLRRSDILVIGAPHSDYADLRPDVPVADVWNLLGRGVGV